MSGMQIGDAHGVALVGRVIESVRADPGRSMLSYRTVPWVAGGAPRPVTDPLTFPSGRPLSPSLRAWLAFDASLMERNDWFDEDGGLAPRTLAELAGDELGEPWGSLFAPIADRFPECFLLPGGSDSRRVLVVTEPDAAGEYPVLAVDVDDLPCAVLMYPGFDVYLAATAELVPVPAGRGYDVFRNDPVYGTRMREHAKRLFGGGTSIDYPFD
ncbi:hypothetical protein [Catenuloplanes indicus]|uniref:Uncharacterized protein n=1 Tax=Catenuloplanes indicus TaxID=137267 RepID=A0AAE3VY60_9ACTN|nr:hypothetical protein [Catenuloplanes indicus]MDQ0365870.1 hypothetical protein [Catenuloplanes indicus]